MSNEDVIRTFYDAFAARDAARMAACYHDDATFSDPVFGTLDAEQARAMWAMLCERGKDLIIEVSDIWADEERGKAHWDARYTFATGKKVLNRIDAAFTFRDGKISSHVDTFDLRTWAGQALGLPGKILGGTNFMQQKIRAQANRQLDNYMGRS